MTQGVEMLPVEQSDRNAAAEYGVKFLGWNRDVVDAINFSRADDSALVQAFARHRLNTHPAATGSVREVNPMTDIRINWLVHQLEAWPTRVDPEKTTNIQYLMGEAARLIRRQPLATAPTPDAAASEAGEVERLREAAVKAHLFAVLTLASLGRDRGTDRQERMLDDLQREAGAIEANLCATLSTRGSAKG